MVGVFRLMWRGGCPALKSYKTNSCKAQCFLLFFFLLFFLTKFLFKHRVLPLGGSGAILREGKEKKEVDDFW